MEAPALARPAASETPGTTEAEPVKVGYFNDSAFTFYYPENLEALERAGAKLEPISALAAEHLPDIDLLYIGGGFPETHASRLSQNRALCGSVRAAACEQGLPIYAECGGLIYLARTLRAHGADYPMSAVLPVCVELTGRPQGHGYCAATVDRANPFFPVGTVLRGHEFHYSRVTDGVDRITTAYAMNRGTGCGQGRDALLVGNVLASYTHLHARGVPEWARYLCRCALGHRRTRRESHAGPEEGSQEGCQEDERRRRGSACGGSRDFSAPPEVST